MMYRRSPDDVLLAAGWDPDWIDPEPGDGPYFAIKTFDEQCPCCDGPTAAWTVVNVEKARGIGQCWFGGDAHRQAVERAADLNNAWNAGAASVGAKSST